MAEPKKPAKPAAAKKAAAKPAPKKVAPAMPAARAPKKAVAAAAAAKKAPAPPVKRAVARPVTRAVVKKAVAPTAVPAAPRVRRPRVEPKPLPTAPAGQVPLIAADGSVAGALALPAALTLTSGAIVLFQAVLAAQANARQGNAATKNRTRVRGGGAKPWRQKGTGRARQGSIRSPQWRHGAVVFGPNGRTYDQRLPLKVRRAALGAAFAVRAGEGRVLVVEELRLGGDRPRTRDLVDWLAKVGEVRRAVLVTPTRDERLERAAANAPAVEIRTSTSLKLLDVLGADTLLVLRGALEALAARASAKEAA